MVSKIFIAFKNQNWFFLPSSTNFITGFTVPKALRRQQKIIVHIFVPRNIYICSYKTAFQDVNCLVHNEGLFIVNFAFAAFREIKISAVTAFSLRVIAVKWQF